MPFKRHAAFTRAPTTASRLWRYMSLAKFLSVLQSRAIFFGSLELMARSDPFEGTLPPSRFVHRRWAKVEDVPEGIRDRLHGFLKPGEGLERGLSRFKDLAELRIRQAYAYRRSYFVSCWHLNDYESAAMWDVYSRRDEGIAIVSSEDRFESGFAAEDRVIYGGTVAYGDYASEDLVIDDKNAFRPVLHKRISFAHEREYRLVHWDTSVTHKRIQAVGGRFDWDGHAIPDVARLQTSTVGRTEAEIEAAPVKGGHALECSINELIEAVYVSPTAEPWYEELVRNVGRTYGLSAPVSRSELLASPMR